MSETNTPTPEFAKADILNPVEASALYYEIADSV